MFRLAVSVLFASMAFAQEDSGPGSTYPLIHRVRNLLSVDNMLVRTM